jgi:hypothetical protein
MLTQRRKDYTVFPNLTGLQAGPQHPSIFRASVEFSPAAVVFAADGLAAGVASSQAFVLDQMVFQSGIGVEGAVAHRTINAGV